MPGVQGQVKAVRQNLLSATTAHRNNPENVPGGLSGRGRINNMVHESAPEREELNTGSTCSQQKRQSLSLKKNPNSPVNQKVGQGHQSQTEGLVYQHPA